MMCTRMWDWSGLQENLQDVQHIETHGRQEEYLECPVAELVSDNRVLTPNDLSVAGRGAKAVVLGQYCGTADGCG